MQLNETKLLNDEERELEEAVRTQESAKHANARWPAGFENAGKLPYRLCTTTVMDTSDPEIRFDATGACHWVADFQSEVADHLPSAEQRNDTLRKLVAEIKLAGAGKAHDCVVGLSGGVDSSYVCLLAKELGLRPLIVHFDNGWNSELAVQNIEHIVRKLGFDLQTLVMDWPEFRDLQRSYFKASVVDLEVPSDHMIFGAMSKIAASHGIRHILSGNNNQTEWLLPRAWYYSKLDLTNLKAIQKTFGTKKLRNLPALGVAQSAYYTQVKGLKTTRLLELIEYDKAAAKERLIRELSWRDYGGKHHESVFTRFYQGYILPRKFNIDKRKAHLSNLILAKQLTRVTALRELLEPPYDPALQREDFTFVAKKLGFSEDELHQLLEQPNRAHREFATDERERALYYATLEKLAPIKPIVRALRSLLRGS